MRQWNYSRRQVISEEGNDRNRDQYRSCKVNYEKDINDEYWNYRSKYHDDKER